MGRPTTLLWLNPAYWWMGRIITGKILPTGQILHTSEWGSPLLVKSYWMGRTCYILPIGEWGTPLLVKSWLMVNIADVKNSVKFLLKIDIC